MAAAGLLRLGAILGPTTSLDGRQAASEIQWSQRLALARFSVGSATAGASGGGLSAVASQVPPGVATDLSRVGAVAGTTADLDGGGSMAPEAPWRLLPGLTRPEVDSAATGANRASLGSVAFPVTLGGHNQAAVARGSCRLLRRPLQPQYRCLPRLPTWTRYLQWPAYDFVPENTAVRPVREGVLAEEECRWSRHRSLTSEPPLPSIAVAAGMAQGEDPEPCPRGRWA